MTPTGRTPKTTTTTTTAVAESPSATASRYQQLRSHLAELKLHAAAEALPAALDQAAAEKLSLTVALERLLAVEVDASTARRLAGRLRFACLPTPATLDDFDVDAAAGIDRALINELGTCRYLESATNVLLIGPPGTGKTHLSVGYESPPRINRNHRCTLIHEEPVKALHRISRDFVLDADPMHGSEFVERPGATESPYPGLLFAAERHLRFVLDRDVVDVGHPCLGCTTCAIPLRRYSFQRACTLCR